MSVNIKVTGGLNIEWGQIDPKATGGLINCVDNYSTDGEVPRYRCGAQTQRNLHEMMPGRLREQQREQLHLLAQMRTATDAKSVQHLLTHFPDARHLERIQTHVSRPLNMNDFLEITFPLLCSTPISPFTPHLQYYKNTRETHSDSLSVF